MNDLVAQPKKLLFSLINTLPLPEIDHVPDALPFVVLFSEIFIERNRLKLLIPIKETLEMLEQDHFLSESLRIVQKAKVLDFLIMRVYRISLLLDVVKVKKVGIKDNLR